MEALADDIAQQFDFGIETLREADLHLMQASCVAVQSLPMLDQKAWLIQVKHSRFMALHHPQVTT